MKEPKIRFKGFKGEWENTPFSETFDSLKNNSLSRAELSDSGEVMNIHYGDVLIKYGECVDVIKEVETFVKDEEVAKKLHQSCAIKNGDVIFADAAEDNTVGKCSEVIANENDAIVSGLHTIACRPKKDFAPMYLGYYLNSNAYHDQLLPHIQGTKISSISKKAISQTHINSPLEKDEQQSISTYFQHLDALIQSTTKKIESLKQVKAASLQSMFPQDGETTPRVRFKGFEGEWSICPLKYFAKKSTEKNISMDYTKTLTNSAEYGVINQRDFFDHDISNDDHINGYYVIHHDDFVYNPRVSTAAPVGPISRNLLGYSGVMSPLYLIFRVNGINKDFLSYYFKTMLWHNYMKLEGNTGARFDRLAISDEQFFNMPICVPRDEKEQTVIASYFTTLDRQITLQTQCLEKLKQIKAACLDNMFV